MLKMFRLCRPIASPRSAPTSESGKESMIVKGCTKLSNCAARMEVDHHDREQERGAHVPDRLQTMLPKRA